MLLSRILEYHEKKPVAELFRYYDDLRRHPINEAFKEASFGFETIQDRGWFTTIIMDWLTWIVLSMRASRKEQEFALMFGTCH